MRELKATIIGAGSTYTPELIEGFINRQKDFNIKSFCLMDIDKKKLDIVGALAGRMLNKTGFKGNLILTQDLDEAISGSDYVFAQIRVGGLAARIRDEKIPLKYGLLGQETTGAGGFMNALRTVPVMLDIARRIEKLSPEATLINFSNPSGIIAEALLNNTRVKVIGLCNCFINMHASIKDALKTEDFDYEYVGLNHLSWIISVMVSGENIIGSLKAPASMKNIPGLNYDDELLASVPGIPSPYLSYFYLKEAQLKKCLEAEKTRGELIVEIEESLLKQYGDSSLEEKPKELSKRGGALYSTAAVSIADAIENDKNEYHVAGVKNNGALPFMEDDDVIEAKCLVNRTGAIPLKLTTEVNPYIKGLMQSVKAYERLTVKAAMTGSRADALAALMVHPLIGDFDKAKLVLDDMLKANAEYIHRGFNE